MRTRKAGRKRSPRTKGRFSLWRHLWRWAWLYVIVLGTVSGAVMAAMIQRPEVEALADFTPGLITSVYDRNQGLLTTYAVENRILLADDQLPRLLRDAVLAVEDARFYQHSGIDPTGILRAMRTNIAAGQIIEGASTLTMQVAENLFHTRGRDWQHKIAEALLAVEIEKRYSKQQILTLYCNIVYMGDGVYGMEAAAQHYFGKSVGDLTVAEAATLAGIPKRPTDYSPNRNPELTLKRRNHVLNRMVDTGAITREEADATAATPIEVVKKRRREADEGAYFSEDVRRQLEEQYGSKELYDAGLQVVTTLDPQIQTVTEAAVRRQLSAIDHGKGWRKIEDRVRESEFETHQLPSWNVKKDLEPGLWFEGIVLEAESRRALIRYGDQRLELTSKGTEWTRQDRIDKLLQPGDIAWFRWDTDGPDDDNPPHLILEQEPEMESAAIVLESATGAIRALVGGWDFGRSKFNRATQAKRQVGSAFKPFVFGAALENGWTAADTLFDAPTGFPGATGKLDYIPRNHHRSYHGILTLRQALEKSINIPSVKLLDLVGVDRVIDFARRCGVASDLPPYPSLALGSADMVPLELAAAYATFANQGLFVEPYMIERVTSSDGRLLEEHIPQARMAMTPETAFLLTHMLEGVVDRGTGASMSRIDIALAGKTGTTNEYSDAWFVGYTPKYTMLVWVGYDVKLTLGRGMTGSRAALPIWRAVLEDGLASGWIEPGGAFPAPGGVTLVDVEYDSGLLPPVDAPRTYRTVREAFLPGTEPTRTVDRKWDQIETLPWYQQRVFYIPKEGERMPENLMEEIEEGDETVSLDSLN
jgi:penicillin-binding protein 1A